MPSTGIEVGIIATGTEIAQGLVKERDAQYLANELTGLGCTVAGWRVVPDDPSEQAIALSEYARFDVVVVTGGTGATPMDQTFAVLANWTGRSLYEDPDVRALLAELADRRDPATRTQWLRNARKQARVPEGAIVLMPAPHATAPAVVIAAEDRSHPVLVGLPGPPSEVRQLWPSVLATEPLRELLATRTRFESRTIRLTADNRLSETLLGATVNQLPHGPYATGLATSVCFAAGGTELNVVTLMQPEQRETYLEFERELVHAYPGNVFSVTGDTVDDIVRTLAGDGATFGVIDLVTAGRVGTRLQRTGPTHTIAPDPAMPHPAALELVRRLGISTASGELDGIPTSVCHTLGADFGVALLHPDPEVGILVCGEPGEPARRAILELPTWPGGTRIPAEVMHELRRLLEARVFDD